MSRYDRENLIHPLEVNDAILRPRDTASSLGYDVARYLKQLPPAEKEVAAAELIGGLIDGAADLLHAATEPSDAKVPKTDLSFVNGQAVERPGYLPTGKVVKLAMRHLDEITELRSR